MLGKPSTDSYYSVHSMDGACFFNPSLVNVFCYSQQSVSYPFNDIKANEYFTNYVYKI